MNVVFLLYNRPDLTARVFSRIRAAQPERLFIVCDGPKPDKPGDRENVAAVRDMVADVHIDWPCEVMRLYAEENMGCRARVSSGLNWVFSEVEDAIILEDDCLPEADFFPFCTELLERYRNDMRIMMVTGCQFFPHECPWSYVFSRLSNIWGWATWRRAWLFYDDAMTNWPLFKSANRLHTIFDDPSVTHYLNTVFDATARGEIDSWGHRWMFSCLAQNGFSVASCQNLVQNLGLDGGGTHTVGLPQDVKARLMPPVGTAFFPLKHPPFFYTESSIDHFSLQHVMMSGSPLRVTLRRVYRWLRFFLLGEGRPVMPPALSHQLSAYDKITSSFSGKQND